MLEWKVVKLKVFGVSGANKNGRKLIEICTENRLSVGNALFEKSISKGLHGQVE